MISRGEVPRQSRIVVISSAVRGASRSRVSRPVRAAECGSIPDGDRSKAEGSTRASACLPKCQPTRIVRARVHRIVRPCPSSRPHEKYGGTVDDVDVGVAAYRERAGSLLLCGSIRANRDPTACARPASDVRREGSDPRRGAARLGEADARRGERRRSYLWDLHEETSGLFLRDGGDGGGPPGPRQHARAHRAGSAASGRRGCIATWISRSTKEIEHFSGLEKASCNRWK